MQDRSVLVSAKPCGVDMDGDGDVDVVIGREDGASSFSEHFGEDINET